MAVRGRYAGHRPNEAAIRAVLGQSQAGGVYADLDRRSLRVMTAAQRLVGVDTGRLLASIRRERGPGYIDIVAGYRGLTRYLGFHHYNTEPHIIRPRRRKALRFVAGGQVVFAAKVNHPGTRGTRFLTRALGSAR